MAQLELIDVDGELGGILPDEILSRLGAMAGAVICPELVLADTTSGKRLTSRHTGESRCPVP